MPIKKETWKTLSMLTLLVFLVIVAVTGVPKLQQPGVTESITIVVLWLIDKL
jgi:hypothetical protein